MKKARLDDRDRAPRLESEPGSGRAMPHLVWVPPSAAAARRAGVRSVLRPACWILGTVAVLLACPSTCMDRSASTGESWDLQITADGEHPVTALVYGARNGILLVAGPAAGS